MQKRYKGDRANHTKAKGQPNLTEVKNERKIGVGELPIVKIMELNRG